MKLTFGRDFNSSGVINGLSIICKDCDGSFLLLLTEPVITVLLPSAFDNISAEQIFDMKSNIIDFYNDLCKYLFDDKDSLDV